MNELSDEQKFQVMMAELTERYNASHQIRERGYQVVLAITGAAVGLAWLLVSEADLDAGHRWGLVALILTLGGGAYYFVNTLRKGFQSNRQALIRVEHALGMFKKGEYLPEESLLPLQYASCKPGCSDLFSVMLTWIIIVGLVLLFLTGLPANGKSQAPAMEPPSATQITQNK